MNQMIIIGLIMVGISVVLILLAHKLNEQNLRLSQYLAMIFLLLVFWGFALMIWGSGGYLVAVLFAAFGTALPLYCLKGMKGTENMSDDELRKYIDDGQTTHMVECIGGNPEGSGMRYQLRAVTQVGDDYEWLDLSIYSETEHFQPGKIYIVMFSDLEQVQVGLENYFGTGETFDVTGVPEECFRPAGVLENTLMKTVKLADRQ